MTEMARQADYLSSLLSDMKAPKTTYINQERRGRGNIPDLLDVIQLEARAGKGSSSSQGVSLSSDAAGVIKGLIEIDSNMSSSSKVINHTALNSSTSRESSERCWICLKEGHVTSVCKLIYNKSDFV